MQRGLDGTKVQVRGQEVIFYDKDEGVNKPIGSPHYSEFDTPANRAIVADVIANYNTLAAAYVASEAAKIQSVDNYKSMIHRRAKALAAGSLDDKYQAILILKEIGE